MTLVLVWYAAATAGLFTVFCAVVAVQAALARPSGRRPRAPRVTTAAGVTRLHAVDTGEPPLRDVPPAGAPGADETRPADGGASGTLANPRRVRARGRPRFPASVPHSVSPA